VTRRRISSGSVYEERVGYSRAVVDGEWIFVSGTTGFDYRTNAIAEDVVAQTHQAVRNIEAALAEADATLDDVVRSRIICQSRADFEAAAPVIGRYFGAARPANTTFVAELVDPRMRIEIEVTAHRSKGS
jgi:enamine deaminase RidA (YjgF/YER057c/UK114 family)